MFMNNMKNIVLIIQEILFDINNIPLLLTEAIICLNRLELVC